MNARTPRSNRPSTSLGRVVAMIAALVLGVSGFIVVPPGGPASAGAVTFTVTSTASDGPGSLRQAVLDAASNSTDDLIQLQPNTTYDVCPTINVPASGGFTTFVRGDTANRSSVIRNTCTQSGASSGSIFSNGGATTLDLNGLTLTDAKGQYGAVYNSTQLVVDNVTFDGNFGRSGGGGIWTKGLALISDSTFNDNDTDNGGGAIHSQESGDITVERSTFTNNVARSSHGGAIWAGFGTTAVIGDSSFDGNRFDATDGSGSSAINGHDLVLVRSSVTNNHSGSRGAAVQATNLTMLSSTVSGNTSVPLEFAPSLSAVYATTSADIRFSTIADNQWGELRISDADVFATVVGDHDDTNQCEFLAAEMTSLGSNVSDDPDCRFGGGPGDQPDVDDVGLLPVADNGGAGLSMHPTWDGPLIDGVTPIRNCAGGDNRDQRGILRPYPPAGGPSNCDVGAIEVDPAQPPPHGFTDVPSWLEASVRWIAFYGYADGYDDATYRPSNPLTRAQFVRMLYRLADEPDITGYPAHGFTDVPAWVDDAVRWAANDPDGAGPAEPVMSGFGTEFRPNDTLNRAQVTRALYRLADEPDITGYPAHGFTDVPAWIDDAVTWIVRDPDAGGPLEPIATGFGTTYQPTDPTNRAQVTRMLYRYDQAGN